MRLNKVYGKGSRLIVCFKGSHFVSPGDTQVTGTQRVHVAAGTAGETVHVNGEVWTLKGSYTDGKPRVKGSSAPKKAARKVLTPSESVIQRIREVAPNPSAEFTLMTCYQNWCRGCTRLSLFQGLNYTDPSVTQAVHQLGQSIMDEFGDKWPEKGV